MGQKKPCRTPIRKNRLWDADHVSHHALASQAMKLIKGCKIWCIAKSNSLDNPRILCHLCHVDPEQGGELMSLQTHLIELERKHRSLEMEIESELQHANADSSKVADLKRRKLLLKDTITKLRNDLKPKTVH
jgi:hypothetical protein